MSEAELNEIVSVYRKHKPKKVDGEEIITIPEYLKRSNRFRGDDELARIVENLPTRLTKMQQPTKELLEKSRRIYIEQCFLFDEIGEMFVSKVLEYASSYQTKPIILYGSPGSGKSHRAKVFASMLGLEYYQVDIPLAAHGAGLSGEAGSYKNAGCGYIAKGMCQTRSCNYLMNSEELDKEESLDGRPSYSEQFLKVTDQDATHFRDNRLGFDIDASHIVYVFTANDRTKISAPMLDRCDVIEVSAPSKREIENIVRSSVIPNTIGNYKTSTELSFSEEAIDFVFQSLWRGSDTSLRQYQNLISKCVNAANYISICEERPVIIQKSDVERQIKTMPSYATARNKIGFC